MVRPDLEWKDGEVAQSEQPHPCIDGDFGLGNAVPEPAEDRLTEALGLLQEIRWRMGDALCACPGCERWRQLAERIDRVLEGT
jgi:hypothetical protein